MKDRDRRNCLNCKHLEYVHDTSYEIQDGGYCCNDDPDEKVEGRLDRMNLMGSKKGYLFTSKICFERRAPGCAKCETYADEFCECTA